MRFTFAESMCDPTQLAPLAIAAEEAGYHSFTVPESICYPEHADTTYPYTADGGREFLEGKPFIDPFVLIPALAAVTERLRFATFVVKLPVRDPVLVAKQAMSVAVLSQDRFDFGVGLSPWYEDYIVTGTEWRGRGRRMDEMIEILRGLSGGEYFEYHGEFFDIPSIKMCPAPSRPIPLLIGGHSEAALRRAARLGDGWMHAGGDEDELERQIERLAVLRREYGREGEPFRVQVISEAAFSLDGVRRLEDRGVTDAIMAFRDPYAPDTMSLEQKIIALRQFAADVIAKL